MCEAVIFGRIAILRPVFLSGDMNCRLTLHDSCSREHRAYLLDGPTITRAEIEQAINNSNEEYGYLYACLAGSGLRINEALANRLGDPDGPHTVFDPASSIIHVRRGLWRGREQDSPKTQAAIRSVELPYALGEMLKKKFASKRDACHGWLFGNGRPMSETTARAHLEK